MKTQLLEDIGQSAPLSLVPSGKVTNSISQEKIPDIAQAPVPARVPPRSAFGVWRQKPVLEPEVPTTQQPEQQSPPVEASPGLQEPVAAVDEPQAPLPPAHRAAIPAAESIVAANAAQSEPARQDPVFDFSPPPPAAPAPDSFKREPTWSEGAGRPYLLWGSCILAGALVLQGGWWIYTERKDESALALVAEGMKAEPQLDKAVKRRALAAKVFTLGPDGEVSVAPAAPAPPPTPLPRTQPAVPPLALLEPGAGADAGAKVEAEPARRAGRERVVAELKPVRARMERTSERQLARAPAVQAESKSESDSAMAETLKACRAHGYHAAQCVKRACSVTKYGFVCRGK